MRKLDIVGEALLMSITGYAKTIHELNDNSLGGEAMNIANNVLRYFRKPKKRYNRQDSLKIVKFLTSKLDPLIKAESSPTIFLIITLNHLITNISHTESRIAFGHFSIRLKSLIEQIELSEYRAEMFRHQKILMELT